MRALVCHAPKDLRLEEQQPEVLGAQQLRIRVAFGGICGSDLHYFQHGGFGAVRLKEPMTLGHEVSGRIDEIGAEVTGFKLGQRIAISPSRPCGACQYCQKGQHNHCLNMRFYGSAMPFPHIQGAFRESLIIDASQAHAVADDLPLSQAALAEPLSVGLHAITRAGSVFWQTRVGHRLRPDWCFADSRAAPCGCCTHRGGGFGRFATGLRFENGGERGGQSGE